MNKLYFLVLVCLLPMRSFSQTPDVAFIPPPPMQETVRMLFLGNSLTLHAPNKDIGWHGNWGMAASLERYDYVHILLSKMDISHDRAYIRNTYPFERDSGEYKKLLRSIKSDVPLNENSIVILQVGDNVLGDEKSIKDFGVSLKETVLDLKKQTSLIFCISTWWERQNIDEAIKSTCERSGGVFVFIGDIYNSLYNPDRRKVTYPNAGVEAHPKDWEMRHIASRIQYVIDEYVR